MGVLSGLLPGFRELRAPLAAGYLYLLTAWLLLSELVPRARPPSGPLADLWDLGGIVGTTVVIAAVTFSAYLLGSFLEIDPQRLVSSGGASSRREPIIRLSKLLGASLKSEQPLSLSASADLDRLAAEAGIPAEYSVAVRSEVIEEMPQLATRLHVKNAEIYGRYDRLVAEGTFRLNVAIPLFLFLSVLAFRTGLAWWLRLLLILAAYVFGVLLAQQGMRRVVAARDVVVQAISIPDLELESRRLKDFRWRLESLRTVRDALYPDRSSQEHDLEHKRRIREAVVRTLQDRPDLVSALDRSLPSDSQASSSQATPSGDTHFLRLFSNATEAVELNLKGDMSRASRDLVTTVDQVLRQLDQIDSGKRPDDNLPHSPGDQQI